MSHELRTPTAQILGVLELVLADKENPLLADHRSLLEQAIRSGDALLELIGAVLVSFFAFLSPLGQMLIVNFRTIGREKS